VKPDGSGGDPKALWPLTLPVVLHRQIHQAAPDDPGRGVEQLRNVPAVRECLFPAMAEFVQARRHCPLLPYAHLGIAELSGLFVGPDEDRLPLERARRLAPADLRILFESGVADLNAGRREVACESFRQGLALGTRYLSEILAVSEERLSLLEVAERVLPDSPQLLLDFAARKQYQSARYTAVRHRLAQRALDAIDQCDLTDDEKCHFRASALAIQERYGEAIAEGERAVRMQPRQLPWRYELAVLLKNEGNLEGAHEHARVCAMLNPSKREYRQLLEQINLARLTSGARAEARN
jgi:tetratricopeptide (TPR) repeat protein